MVRPCTRKVHQPGYACNSGSPYFPYGEIPKEAQYMAIADGVEAYERRRWPDGKAPGGKG